MKINIPITKTFFDNDEKEIILKPLETGWVVQGPFVNKFQDKFKEFTIYNVYCVQDKCQ